MTDTTEGAPAPKKRSLFKRAAWQDAPKKEEEDMFSHAKDFKNIVAEQTKREDEKRRKANEERKRRQDGQADRKRRKVSGDLDEPALPGSGSGNSSSGRATRMNTKARSRTPLSPVPSKPPPDSLASRYESLSKNAAVSNNHIIDLGGSSDVDDADDAAYEPTPFSNDTPLDYPSWGAESKHDIAMRPPRHIAIPDDDDDEPEEVLDPALAKLAAQARQRAAASARAAAGTGKAPIVQLFISPEIPNAKPLMVKARIDSTLEKTRLAWCGKQGYDPIFTKDVFFTWRGQRMYDSTTIKRLGIQVDAHGNISLEGDTNIYDEVDIPKVHVEAWTPALYQEHKRQEAVASAAKRKAAEPEPEPEPRDPTPEPAPKVKKFRLIMKAKGKEELKLQVHPDTTFGHIASAFKQSRGVEESQPVTLMFDGERLAPMDTVADSEIENMDSIDVLFK